MSDVREVAVRSAFEGKTLLVFDLDGTLVDTSPLHEEAFNQVLAAWNIRVDYSAIAGMRTREAMRKSLEQGGVVLLPFEIDELVQRKQQAARELIRSSIRLLPGVEQFLTWAKSRYRMAVCSSGSRNSVAMSLGVLGIDKLFDPVVNGDDVNEAKPDPGGYLKVLALAATPASEALAFEDSHSGIEAARLAGIPAVDVRLVSFANILEALE